MRLALILVALVQPADVTIYLGPDIVEEEHPVESFSPPRPLDPPCSFYELNGGHHYGRLTQGCTVNEA